jgi:5-formyltetrahydrofolate cyclo-ligase
MGRPCAQTQGETLRGLNIPAQFSKKSQWTQGTRARAISGYWPIKGEPELRPLIKELHDAGTEIVLPVVDAHAPLVLRR